MSRERKKGERVIELTEEQLVRATELHDAVQRLEIRIDIAKHKQGKAIEAGDEDLAYQHYQDVRDALKLKYDAHQVLWDYLGREYPETVDGQWSYSAAEGAIFYGASCSGKGIAGFAGLFG